MGLGGDRPPRGCSLPTMGLPRRRCHGRWLCVRMRPRLTFSGCRRLAKRQVEPPRAAGSVRCIGGGLLLLRGMGQDGMRRRHHRFLSGRLCQDGLRRLPGLWLPGLWLLSWQALRGLLLSLTLQTHLPQFLFQLLDVLLLLCGQLLFRLRRLWLRGIRNGLGDIGGRQVDGLRTALIGVRADLHAEFCWRVGRRLLACGCLNAFVVCLDACETRIRLWRLIVAVFAVRTGQHDRDHVRIGRPSVFGCQPDAE